HDVKDFYRGEEKIVLCAGCRYKLASGQKVVGVKQIGRPSLGVTKKVSLTLPEAVWEHLDTEAKGNRSEYLRKLIDSDMWSEGDWSNNACLGYAILGAQKLGYSEEQLGKLVRAIYSEFDRKSIDEAREVYNQSPY
ncbi:MAG: hypothetical protein ACK4UN_01350, partial [Limisphaerales bacterium]